MAMLELTEEQEAFVAAIRDFGEREAGDRETRRELTDDHSESHNQRLYEQMAGLGWLGVAIPEEYGGSGGGMVDACLFMEETSRALIPIGGYGTTLIVAKAYERFGSEAQKKDILGGIAGGAVEAIAMSEPEAGSDVGNLSCRAERVDGGWRVNGQKTWCSNAHIAEHILLVARTTRTEDKHQGLTMLNVPTGIDGLETSRIETMGTDEVNDLYFTDCLLPEDAVIGEVDQAWDQLMAGLNVERLILAALMLGVGERAFDDALAYIKEREQFGKPVGQNQALSHRIADLATELRAAKLLTYDVAMQVDDDPDRLLPRQASMAKLKATETSKEMALAGMQMMGGYGYASEYDMERLVRSTIVSTIYGGTSEIQREIIATTYGL